MAHLCHATSCEKQVPPLLHFCAFHWQFVPAKLAHNLVTNYRTGQEIRKDPSPEYIEAHLACVAAIDEALI